MATNTNTIELACRCGEIHGALRHNGDGSDRVNRVICYCDDCQSFAHYLERSDLLDEHAGTDIVQVAPSTVMFDRKGAENIACVRLSPKGLYRWYARCCKTPIGNVWKASVPFVGLGSEIFRGVKTAEERDALFGKPRALILGKYATNGAPEGSTKLDLRFMAHTVGLLAGWKIRGKTWPHPFFDASTREPITTPTILTLDERETLRELCGPNPKRTPSTIAASPKPQQEAMSA